MDDLFLRGLVLGFSIAAPVGPIGVLCIRRTLAQGSLSGLVSGLGAASADALYGSVVAFGLTVLSGFLTSQQQPLQLVGGLFLCYLGIKTFLAQPAEQPANIASNGLVRDYLSTLALTLTNPVTIMMFFSIFASFGVAAGTDLALAAIIVLGVFCGSATWWLILSGGVGLLRSRFNVRALRWVNRLSGIIIEAFGVFAFGEWLKLF